MTEYNEKLEAQMEIAKAMKVGELKLKLQAKGVLTTTFCEKSEFIKAYAEVMVKEAAQLPIETVSDGEDDNNNDDGNEEVMTSQFPATVMHRIEKLKLLNDEREEQRKLYLEERAKLEAKYNKLSQPLYKKRIDIILGKKDEDIKKEFGVEGDTEEEPVVGIPQFLVCAIGNMGPVAELISEPDIDCLEHLYDIECVDHEGGEGFTLCVNNLRVELSLILFVFCFWCLIDLFSLFSGISISLPTSILTTIV